jgi:hypothetical protein
VCAKDNEQLRLLLLWRRHVRVAQKGSNEILAHLLLLPCLLLLAGYHLRDAGGISSTRSGREAPSDKVVDSYTSLRISDDDFCVDFALLDSATVEKALLASREKKGEAGIAFENRVKVGTHVRFEVNLREKLD